MGPRNSKNLVHQRKSVILKLVQLLTREISMAIKTAKLKWYHWIIGLLLGLALIWWDQQPSTPKCSPRISGGIKSINDAKNFSGCSFQHKDDTPVAVGNPAELITVRFTQDLTQCIWEEQKVTESAPYFTRNIPLNITISKYIDTGKDYLKFSCNEPDLWSQDGNTMLSRNQTFTADGSGTIFSRSYGIFYQIK